MLEIIPKAAMISFSPPHKWNICFLVLFYFRTSMPGVDTGRDLFWTRSICNLSMSLWKYCYDKKVKIMLLHSLMRFFLSIQAEHVPTELIEEIFLWQFYDAVLLGLSSSKEHVINITEVIFLSIAKCKDRRLL